MSLLHSTNEQIAKLNKKKEELLALKEQIPDAPYHIFSINAMIRDAEMKHERLRGAYSAIKCSQCMQSVTDQVAHVNVGRKTICERCLKTISQVMNTTEMEEKAGIKTGIVKQDCHQSFHFLQESGLVRKSNKCWLVHEVLIELFYSAGRDKSKLKMSWVEEMEAHLTNLQIQMNMLNEMKGLLSGVSLQLFSLDAQIRDYENRIKIVKGGTYPFKCSQCQGWIKEQGLPVLIDHYTLCNQCKKTIQEVLTSSEAESKYNLYSGRIRRDIHRGLLDTYKEKGLLRQSGSIWLIHESVIQHHYYPEKKEPTEESAIPPSLLARQAAIFQGKGTDY